MKSDFDQTWDYDRTGVRNNGANATRVNTLVFTLTRGGGGGGDMSLQDEAWNSVQLALLTEAIPR